MSQPRRRRRRRRGAPRPPEGQSKRQKRSQPQRERAQEAGSSRRRKRRGRGGQGRKSPASSEDLVRAEKKPRPETLTGPPDGTTLEQVIGDLQSEWGVPQNPQEYRLVFKVPEEKDGSRSPDLTATEEAVDPPDEQTDADKPRREKAPAAPRIVGSGAGNGKTTEASTPRRRRGRRRRKRSKGSGGG